jgi:Ca2+-binding RTX toxin-like protein
VDSRRLATNFGVKFNWSDVALHQSAGPLPSGTGGGCSRRNGNSHSIVSQQPETNCSNGSKSLRRVFVSHKIEAQMTTYTWNQDQNQGETWMINASNATWIVGEDADFKVDDGGAIYELDTWSNNTFQILGDIETADSFHTAVESRGAGANVLIGETSRIRANASAVEVYGLDASVVSHGVIKAGETGIYAGKTATLENHGSIRAEQGISAFDVDSEIDNYGDINAKRIGIGADGDGSRVVNHVDGNIVANKVGADFAYVDGDHVLVNEGLIDAKIAVNDGEGDLRFVNRGTIDGNVLLGDGADTLDSRGGEVIGVVLGGKGNDTYILSDSSVKILEGLGGGYDTVRSSADSTLSTGFEALHLIGGKDIDGHGSRSNNDIAGNDGDNDLFGHGGKDWISGEGGRDILTGGDGADTFTFGIGFGRDTITDYQDGEDRISLLAGKVAFDFESLEDNLQQHGDDVWITLGKGDRLVVEDTELADLTMSDFLFGGL